MKSNKKHNNKHNNKKGYTLLELMIVLSILSIGTFIVSPNLKVFSDKKARIEMDYAVDGIIELINTGKAYGRLQEKVVLVKVREKDIVFMADSKVIGKFEFPQSISNVGIIGGDTITITRLGNASAKSINIYSKNHYVKPETITVKVGTSYVSRKKK